MLMWFDRLEVNTAADFDSQQGEKQSCGQLRGRHTTTGVRLLQLETAAELQKHLSCTEEHDSDRSPAEIHQLLI